MPGEPGEPIKGNLTYVPYMYYVSQFAPNYPSQANAPSYPFTMSGTSTESARESSGMNRAKCMARRDASARRHVHWIIERSSLNLSGLISRFGFLKAPHAAQHGLNFRQSLCRFSSFVNLSEQSELLAAWFA